MNQAHNVDQRTVEAEEADAARSHGADRGPSEEEERLAEQGAQRVDHAEVAKHEQEMDELGADVNAADQGGTTPLIAAAPDDDWPAPTDPKLMALLIEHGANVNAIGNNGCTALMGASFYGDFEVVKLLLKAGAKVSTADAQGRTAISLAVEANHLDIASFLKGLP